MAIFVSKVRICLEGGGALQFKSISNNLLMGRELARDIAVNGYGYECDNGKYTVISSNDISRVRILSSKSFAYMPKGYSHKCDYGHRMIKASFKKRKRVKSYG